MDFDIFNNTFPSNANLPPVDTEDFGVIKTMRKQYAWYFEKTGKDAFGQPTYAAPVLLNVRWDDFVDQTFTQGRVYENDVSATVYLPQRVKVGDILMREESQTIAPQPDVDYIVRDYKEYPNLRNTAQLRIAIL